MKDWAFAVSMPLCLIILFCGFAIMFGTNPWVVIKATTICVPITAYVLFATFTVVWAIKTGEVGLHQNMTFQSKFYFWHGISVVACIVLAAAGSFIVFFASQMRGLIGG